MKYSAYTTYIIPMMMLLLMKSYIHIIIKQTSNLGNYFLKNPDVFSCTDVLALCLRSFDQIPFSV